MNIYKLCFLLSRDCNILLNEINTFQCKYDDLQEENEKQHKGFLAVCKEAKDLEQRIDKALDYIYENAYDTDKKCVIDDLWGNIEELVNILKGE